MNNRIIDINITQDNPTEPLTLQEVKDHLKITYSDDDSYITALITQVRDYAERICSISIIERMLILTADWNCEWQLPYGPNAVVTEVKFRTGTTSSGVADYQFLIDDDWTVDGITWTRFNSTVKGRNMITYCVGWGVLIPEGLKLALLNEISFRYEHRGDNELVSREDIFLPYTDHSWD